MTFPNDWGSIKNPENAVLSTVTPIFLADNQVIPSGPASLPAKQIPESQVYNVYLTGSFNAETLTIEWSLDNITFTPFFNAFDGAPITFTQQGQIFIPRVAAGVYVRVASSGVADTGNVTIVLQ